MKKIFSKEVKIGIAFVVSIIILYCGISFLKGINIFKPKNTYVIVFDDVRDLTISSPVLVNGYKVGLVSAMNLCRNNKVAATINLNDGIQLTKDSKIFLDVSMLGSSALLIDNNPSNHIYYSPSDTVIGSKTPNFLKKMQDSIMPQIAYMTPKVDSIISGLEKVVTNPALIQSMQNMQTITANLIVSTNQLNTMMATLNKSMPALMKSTQETLSNVDHVTTQLKEINLVSTYKSLDSTMKNLQYMSNKLTMKDNSLGLLMNDRKMYDSLNTTINNAGLLLKDIRQNPRRYINVKVF